MDAAQPAIIEAADGTAERPIPDAPAAAAGEQAPADIVLMEEEKAPVVPENVQSMQMLHSAAAPPATRSAVYMGVVASGLVLLLAHIAGEL